MGYFSNGTEGMMYQEDYCMKCAHEPQTIEEGCAVMDAHVLFGYGAEGELRATLDLLIPMEDNKIYNDKCAMFMERKDNDQSKKENQDNEETKAKNIKGNVHKIP